MEEAPRRLVVRGRHILKGMRPDGTPDLVEDGAVLVEDDLIVAVGPFAEPPEPWRDAEVLGSGEHVVIPGLVNAHHHTGLTPLQLGVPFRPLELWLPRFAGMRRIDPYLDTLYGAIEMIESGVTTVQHIHSGPSGPHAGWMEAPTRIMQAYADIGMRASFSFMLRDRNRVVCGADEEFLATLPEELRGDLSATLASTSFAAEDLIEHFEDLAARWQGTGGAMTRVQLAPANLHWCSDASLALQRDCAERHGVCIHMHLLETPYQREFAHREYGVSAVRRLADLGLLGPRTTLGHAIWADETDIGLIAETGTCVCHNPSSGLRLQSGIAPVSEFLAAGVTVALGIDQSGINDDHDMLQEMRVAWSLQRTPGHDHAALSAADVLRMATEHSAATTGFADQIGRIDAGRRADMVLMLWSDIARPHVDEATPFVDALLHRARSGAVRTVLVGGNAVLRDGHLTGIDKEAVLHEIETALRAPSGRDESRRREVAESLEPHLRRFYAGWRLPDAAASFRSWNARW